MDIIKIAVILFYCASLISLIYCKTFNDTSYLARQLKNIPPDVLPRLNQNEFVNVSITAFIASILDYNEVSGTLQAVVTYYLTWTDEMRRWNSSAYGNVSSINLPITSTWIPEISVNNMVRQKTILMYHNDMEIRKAYVSYKSDGSAVFLLGGAQKLSCSSDVKYFPFDSHACSIELTTTHAFDNVIITSAIKTIDLTYGVPNPKWSITENVVQSNVYVYSSLK
ncbi:unnamed protein product [Mytilus edulis]|uniref:Neurotransmitter-gated ion-channel ligand-binding domain-containing protein n=1 Tax=Mytilus edulis TaxID=6550 RepID=A0A8S3T6L3_MYTED|nr:unnamed protein product [Mytilus edulis]